MAKKKDTRFFWISFGVAAVGGFLWWRSRQAHATTSKPRFTIEVGEPTILPSEYDPIPGSNYAYAGNSSETMSCVDFQNGMSVPMNYCDAALEKYMGGA